MFNKSKINSIPNFNLHLIFDKNVWKDFIETAFITSQNLHKVLYNIDMKLLIFEFYVCYYRLLFNL